MSQHFVDKEEKRQTIKVQMAKEHTHFCDK